jgi:hypothetical protein
MLQEIAVDKVKEPLIKSHAVATAAFRDGMREERRSQWPLPLASRATKQTARKNLVPPGCGKMRRLRCCAPRRRSPGYDLRRAPRIHPHFAATQSAEDLIRGSLSKTRPDMCAAGSGTITSTCLHGNHLKLKLSRSSSAMTPTAMNEYCPGKKILVFYTAR